MSGFGKVAKAAMGIGFTWGLAWLAAGLVLLAIVGLDAADVPFPLVFGFLGFLCGATFALVLRAVDARRPLVGIRTWTFAGWGAVGGMILATGFALVTAASGDTTVLRHLPMLLPIFGGASALCAAGSAVLARRADGPALPRSADRDALPRSGPNPDEG